METNWIRTWIYFLAKSFDFFTKKVVGCNLLVDSEFPKGKTSEKSSQQSTDGKIGSNSQIPNITQQMDRLIDWLIDWLTTCIFAWYSDWLIDWLKGLVLVK